MTLRHPDQPTIGSFVHIRFGARATQVAHIEGVTKTGKVKARAYNATQGHWMPNCRTLDLSAILGLCPSYEVPDQTDLPAVRV